MKKLLKISLLCSALWLAGCGDDTQSSGAPTISYEPHIAKALTRETQIKFQLSGANPSVPLPSYALMNPQDGTLNLPTDGDNSPSNPRVAMNQLDGWSTTMPLYLDFTGGNLATGAITDGVYLVELTDSMTGSPQPKANVDFVAFSDTATNKIAIYPTKPLNPASNYILAITSEVKDAQGKPIGTSSSYATLKSKQRIYSQGQLAQLQKITHGTEALFSATVDAEQIVYSTWFSTQSVGDTLNAVAAATAFGASKGTPLAIWPQTFVHQNDAYQMSFKSTQNFETALENDARFIKFIAGNEQRDALIDTYKTSGAKVNVTHGSVTLPYYLETGANWNTQAFSAASPSLAKISAALKDPVEQAHLAAQLIRAGIDLTELATSQEQQMKLVGLELTKTDGSRLDSERLITRYSPLPSIKSLQTVPFLLFTPKTGEVKNVVIYQHGITSAKENAYAFAFRLAQAGLAVIAIDMPLHGERSLDEQRSANTNVLAYLNLANLPVARDNVRQSILDVLALRAALTLSQSSFIGSPLENVNIATGSQIKLLGHSLGGIVGLSALAASEQDLGNPQANALYHFSAAAIHNSGGRIAPLLFGSDAFAPQIKHNLALTSAQYKAFADTYCIGQTDSACYGIFEQNATELQKAQLNALFAQFSFAAQSVLDSIDPMANLASGITTPLLLTQVHNDDTVPNVTKEAGILPFAGTEPVASLLGLEWINKNSSSVTKNEKVFIQYNATAKHSTFITPQNGILDWVHHGQMQEQTVKFFLNNQLNGEIPETVLH
ncbi:lipase [bacterium 19MO03SA05]|uniref:Lipase n=1 Tax=bacterium 19MO03SA05 TaxID=2920620 RepID=A0AAU6VJ30_UNCXX|nr:MULTISPECIES: VolA/Pla-1 family phospholipase [unclassified Vibrio]EKO3570912.1 lipase [Vibrio metschnikovii]EKO3920852.1 lipase [Vibrio metschnikovii]MDQ2108348.1 lipase [Vibrio sp. 2017_1457_15]MDQ2161338.1 lipase [Vibrio sp. 2017_1457_13]MDQ2189468.1 lipase [Vibrio sp. A14(2019)]